MNLQAIIRDLRAMDDQAPLVFCTPDYQIRGGYHVTEVRMAEVMAMDCGKGRTSRLEASMQLLDGAGGDHLKLSKFMRILNQSVANLDDLADIPVKIEFAPNNIGLRIYRAASTFERDGVAYVELQEDAAACRPVLAQKSGQGLGASCYAEGMDQSCC